MHEQAIEDPAPCADGTQLPDGISVPDGNPRGSGSGEAPPGVFWDHDEMEPAKLLGDPTAGGTAAGTPGDDVSDAKGGEAGQPQDIRRTGASGRRSPIAAGLPRLRQSGARKRKRDGPKATTDVVDVDAVDVDLAGPEHVVINVDAVVTCSAVDHAGPEHVVINVDADVTYSPVHHAGPVDGEESDEYMLHDDMLDHDSETESSGGDLGDYNWGTVDGRPGYYMMV